MIRYDRKLSAMRAAISAIDPNWWAKVEKRRRKFRKLGRYEERSPIWSVVKPVFVRLQHGKCIYCERLFEGETGPIEYDLEHYRPKASVKVWPDKNVSPQRTYPFATGDEMPEGYFWLAYRIENYAASCKQCNSSQKAEWFPVAGNRASVGTRLSGLSAEEPYLCYPIGNKDTDPESLVTFLATTAIPAAPVGHNRDRGQVIIDLLGLNDRELLHKERARMITAIGPSMAARAQGTATSKQLQAISMAIAGHVPHTACLRAFDRCWQRDPALANRIHEGCLEYAFTQGGVPPVF